MPVYFVRSGREGGQVKIGLASDVQRRLAGLQTSHPEKLILFRVLDGNHTVERHMHERFRGHRLNGRVRFFRQSGTPVPSGGPVAPSVLVAYGADDGERLRTCGIAGHYMPLRGAA